MQFEALLRELQSVDGGVRSRTVIAMGMLGDARAVPALIEVLCDDKEVYVQEDATWALVRLGELAVEPLIEKLNDNNFSVRHNAAHTLGKIGNRRAVDVLIDLLEDSSPQVRLKAIFALGQIGDARAVKHIIGLLLDESLEVRQTVVDTLVQFGTDAIDELLQVLGHPNWLIREAAASALGDIGGSRVVDALILALTDSVWQVRFAAVNALVQVGDAKSIEPIRRLSTDEHSQVRSMAAFALQQIKAI